MRFLVDANLPRSAFELFIKLGHATEFVRDIGMGAAPDGVVAARARETGAAIVTRDLDFSDIRQYPPSEYAGIMVLRFASSPSWGH
jgi:predicted nuclease of predicted toxin-antitoxin system